MIFDKNVMILDLNADLGEGAGFDAVLMPLITSANICCGLHAGGPEEMRKTVELAEQYGVAIGAHPGYDDREHFGRREQHLLCEQLIQLVRSQIEALARLAPVRYVKAHGALYNQACRDSDLASAFAESVQPWGVPIVGLPGSRLESAAKGIGLPFVSEGFADRRYRPDGSLVPRTEPDAFVHDPAEAVQQVERLIREHGVQTICVHGDNPHAVTFASSVRDALLRYGYQLKPFA